MLLSINVIERLGNSEISHLYVAIQITEKFVTIMGRYRINQELLKSELEGIIHVVSQ